MELNRRQFVILTAAAAAACNTALGHEGEEKKGQAGGASPPTSTPSSGGGQPSGQVADAGPVSEFVKDDVYDEFREQGFFVIRRDKQLFALSSVCTHKGCKVRVADDLSFFCKCHKSTYDRDGHVTKGPARRDLPRLAIAENEQKHILVNLEGVPKPDTSA